MAKKKTGPRAELTRRNFLGYAAGAGALMSAGFPRWALAAPKSTGKKEERTYVFNFSHFVTKSHDLVLVAGNRRHKVKEATPADRKKARKKHPILQHVPDDHITHHVTVDMPADALQVCWVQRSKPGKKTGRWDMVHLFTHHPASALEEAKRRRQLLGGPTTPHPVPHKWQRYGITPELRTSLNDPVGEEAQQDTYSQAATLVSGHPELVACEPNAAAHIQTNIVDTKDQTQDLADTIADLGPATTEGGWATLKPIQDPNGVTYKNSSGEDQCVPVYSDDVNNALGHAILPCVSAAKNDTLLGVNVTDIDPTTLTSGDPNAPTNSAIWTLHDGTASVAQAGGSLLTAEEALQYQLEQQGTGKGFSLKVKRVEVDGSEVGVEIQAQNWYVRYLGLYVRYLDGNDQPIPLANIEGAIKDRWPSTWTPAWNHTYDAYAGLIFPEWVVLGIPVKTRELERLIPVPEGATSVRVLAGGLGAGSNTYPQTTEQGIAMTAIFNLAIPALLLAMAAAEGYGVLTEELEEEEVASECLKEALEFISWAGLDYSEPEAFAEIAIDIAKMLLEAGAAVTIAELIAEAIAEGEAVDAIPLVGLIISAIFAAGLLVQIEETSMEVGTSPKTYVDTIRLTHDVKVTIDHDPDDPAGFPATATHYIVTAQFDGGTPHVIRESMPGITQTEPIVVTFTDVPAGGKVKIDVGFYSNTEFLVGRGTICPVPNTTTEEVLELELTIEEILVPLLASTHYAHKEVIALDDGGNHKWKAQALPPAVVTPDGHCENVNGDICKWNGITVSTRNAAVGYSWQSYNSAVVDCASGAHGQLHQFANISITGTPQSKYFFSGCGFSSPARIVYDLMGELDWNFYLDTTGGGNYIRQIRLGANPGFDGPTSNKAFGRLQLPSDALLLHPTGKIVSINTALNKIEVLNLPKTAGSDASAPRSEVRSGVGTREGLLNGPVHAAITSDGAILVLESQNNRVQAFNLGGNPIKHFGDSGYFFPLVDTPTGGKYLDISVEYSGFVFVLSYTHNGAVYEYRLDIYTPDGVWLSRTTGINADKLAVNYWRDLFTLNYEALTQPNGQNPGRTEPSVSHWIPSTPDGPVNVLPYTPCA